MTGEMPVRPEPGETETTTSYASRLARANGFRNLQRFCGFVGVTLIDLAAGRESALARFSVLGSVDVDRLRRTATFDRRDGRFQVGDEIMSHMDVRRRDIAFCPHCVAEDIDAPSMLMPEERSWQRLAWRFLPITVCREHAIELVSVTLPAGLRNGDYASALEWCFEAGEVPERSEPAVFSRRQAYLSDRLHGRATPLDEFVDGMRWYAAARLFEVVGAADLLPGMIRWRRVRADLDPAATADRGFDILSAGEDAFRTWAVERIEQSRHDTGVLWPGARSIFGDLADTLERTPDPAYDRVRSILIEAAFGYLPLAAGESFLGRPLPERRFHSVRSAASAACVDVETMTRLLVAEGHVDPCDDIGPDRVTIPAAEADRIAENWRNRIPAAEAAHSRSAASAGPRHRSPDVAFALPVRGRPRRRRRVRSARGARPEEAGVRWDRTGRRARRSHDHLRGLPALPARAGRGSRRHGPRSPHHLARTHRLDEWTGRPGVRPR